MSAVSPCTHPRCDRGDNGNRQLVVGGGMCDPCRSRYRREIDWLALDYVTLKTGFPSPARRSDDGARHGKRDSFGHPAEWASDTARDIAQMLNWIEDGLREHLALEPPPHPGHAEPRLIAHAHATLTARFDALCTYPDAEDSATEISDAHWKIRRALGQSRFVQHLPAPCPWCDTAALVREVGSVSCRECGKVIDETHYDWLAGWLVDRMIEDYDAQKAGS